MTGPSHVPPAVALLCILLPSTLGTPSEEWSYGTDAAPDTPWAKKEEVKRIQPPDEQNCDCGPDAVSCQDHEGECVCVHQDLVCDGQPNCAGAEDEYDCRYCPGFVCDNGECLESRNVKCDGFHDCGDLSDEISCIDASFKRNCSAPGQFMCADGSFCVSVDWLCDHDFDCHDKSDEFNCTSGTTCSPSHHQCTDGQCIYSTWVCDTELDCADGSDEMNCKVVDEMTCKDDRILCALDGRCIMAHYGCDGENDCGDWSDERDCPVDTCLNDQFRCHDGSCVEAMLVCDGQEDCPGGEDEAKAHCPVPHGSEVGPEGCHPGYLSCGNMCIAPTWQCDGEEDCLDGSDEAHCPTCTTDVFTCASGMCIAWGRVCDGHHDCLHGDDEKDCEAKECERLQCSFMCNHESEKNCLCEAGYTLSPTSNTTCVDLDECEVFSPCSQYCHNTPGSFRCSCGHGYFLRPDTFSCKSHDPRPSLVFANRIDIRQISVDGNDYSAVAENLQNAISLDFHYYHDLIFWSDVSLDVIMRAYLNGTGHAVIVRWGLRKPSGVCVDWINSHVYWVDGFTSRIEVAELDGTNRRTILRQNLRKPRALVLYPQKNLMLWTDWGGNATIERAYLDGSGRQVIISENIFWPNGITIDYPTEIIYWVDAKLQAIESANTDGSNRKMLLQRKHCHPFAITVFEDDLYWTDWETKSIHSASKKTGRYRATFRNISITFPMDIRSMHAERQQIPYERTGCALDNGGCSHLCLPGPDYTVCFCPHGLALLPDLKTCSARPDNILVFAQRSNLRMLHLNYSREDVDSVLPVDGVVSAVALDFYTRDDLIFWTDIEAKTISRAHLNGSNQMMVVRDNLELPAGVAVDWVTEKLYWADAGTHRIEVSHLNGSMRSLLVWRDLDKPRDIVVDPQDGYMFWTDWGADAKIERAGMDGKDRVVLVATGLMWPNGLAIDHGRRVLYWLDASLNRIEKADLDGTHRETLISNLSHPFGLTLWQQKIIWSDWDTKSIHMANIRGEPNREILVEGQKGLMDVRVFQRGQAHPVTPCHSYNGGCSHLCLLRPGGYSCACPTGVLLKSDGHTCQNGPLKSLVFAQQYEVRQLSLDTRYQVDVVLPIEHQIVDAFDIDPVTGDIFLADKTSRLILRSSMDGRRMRAIVSAALDEVEGLALDTTGRKMYWTDLTRQSVEVCELDGTNRRVLFTKLDQPRAITTYYPAGKLFWTDWDDTRPRIEVADMDGNERKILVKDNVIWPNGLTVDWTTEVLYWTDAKANTIQAIHIDGRNRRTLISGVPHPYGITVLGDFVYWTDWNTKSLNRTDKTVGHPIATLRVGLLGPADIKAVPGPPVKNNQCGRNNGQCSHLCLRHPTGFSCACPTGLLVKPNNKKQCMEEPQNYVVFASLNMLGRISLDTDPMWDVPLEVPRVSKPVVVDYHRQKDLLFYIDLDLDAILVVSLKNLSHPWKLLSDGLNTPDGLAVDWLADNLYWTDAGRKVIEVVKLDGSCRKIIVKTDLLEPRAIAVFPEEGMLFWSDWGNKSKIERSYLDGSGRRVLVDQEIGWPNGIAIDYKTKRIYWNDAKKYYIKSCDLDGGNEVLLVHSLPHPFGLTLLGDHIYWTDWRLMTVERADKSTGLNKQILIENIEGIMGIKAVTKSEQEGWTPCADRNGGCTHLCLYHPDGIRCACPDAPDSRSCSDRPVIKVGKRPGTPIESPRATFQPPRNPPGTPGLIPLLAVLVVVAVLAVAAMVTVVVWWNHKKKTKMVEAPNNGALTYTNPTYSASNSDVNTSKPFWKRLHHEANHQGRMFEEKGEVAALISEGSSVEHESPPPTPPTRTDTAP